MIRIFDILLSFLALLLFAPFFLIISVAIKLDSKGPIFYRQLRVGLNGIEFYILKFCSMRPGSDNFSLITIGEHDSRITSVGFFLRKYKLDELPQLINVLIGQMSLVGPRPEVKKYVNLYTNEQRKVLSVRPGITDWASIIYRNESILLKNSLEPEFEYINIIMPNKIKYNLIFIEKYNLLEYIKILIFTIVKIIFRKFQIKLYN